MKRRIVQVGAVALTILSCTLVPLFADDAAAPAPAVEVAKDSPAATLGKAVVSAYASTDTYRARKTVTFAMTTPAGNQNQEITYDMAYDRKAGRMVIDTPHMRLVAGDKMVRLAPKPAGTHYVEQKVDQPMDLRVLSGVWPMFSLVMGLPDVSLLLGQDLPGVLIGDKAELLEADAGGRQGLLVNAGPSVLEVRVDPATSLIASAMVRSKGEMPDGKEVQTVITYGIEVTSRNEPIDGAVFAFDAGAAVAVGSLQEMLGGGAAAAADRGSKSLEGKAAPAIELPTLDGKAYKLSEDAASVIILDFWATWCGPCRQTLPNLQNLHDWVGKEKKSVAIYAVNLGEDQNKVATFWKDRNLTVPVLMDTQETVGQAYMANAIPQTVIISGGKVYKVYVGALPNLEEMIRKDIETLLTPGN